MAINFNQKGNPMNISYNNNGTPNVYVVKNDSNQTLWVKPYEITEIPYSGQIGIYNTHLVPDDCKIIGEWGYINIKCTTDTSYNASIRYMLYYSENITPTSSPSFSSSWDGNYYFLTPNNNNENYFFIIDSTNIHDIAYQERFGWDNGTLYTTIAIESTEAIVRVNLGTYNSSTGQMNWGLSIDYWNSWPGSGGSSDYDNSGSGIYYDAQANQIGMTKTIYHYLCLTEKAAVYRANSMEPSTGGELLSEGDTAYYYDLLEIYDPNEEILFEEITVDNGFNNLLQIPGFWPLIAAWEPYVDADYVDFTIEEPATVSFEHFLVKEYGYNSGSPQTQVTNTYGSATIPYWDSLPAFLTKSSYPKSISVTRTSYIGNKKQISTMTANSADFPSSMSKPSITGSFTPDKQTDGGNGTSNFYSFNVVNNNSFPVYYSIVIEELLSDGDIWEVTKSGVLTAGSSYSYGDDNSDFVGAEMTCTFQALGYTQSAILSVGNSVGTTEET